jgi:two-component system nitrogen regulation sensor histidine kinase NtrY
VAEPFFTTKPGHLGLGLAISADVAQRHGGRVALENRGEGGARATLELPAAPPEGGT